MPRNASWMQKRRQFRKPTAGVESNYLPNQRKSNNKSNDICQNCGRSLKFYTHRSGPLCQICSRVGTNFHNEFETNNAQTCLPSISGSDYQSTSFEVNEQNFDQERYPARPDTWQRRIYISDKDEPPDSFKNYEDSYDFQDRSENQRTINCGFVNNTVPLCPPYEDNLNYELQNNSYEFQDHSERQRAVNVRPINNTQPPVPPYKNNSNYVLLHTYAENNPFNHKGGHKRKRGPEDGPAKRKKNPPYETATQLYQFNQLNQDMLTYFNDNIQTEEAFARKMALRSRLQHIIQKRFSGCGVFIFGSSMTGFATKTSDADMSLIFYDAKIVKNRVLRLLWELRTLFSNYRNFTKLKVINAKVSILKFQDNLSGFEVDLNINNPTGIRNSQLLRSYARLDDRVQPLVLGVKFWAREHNINDAKNGTLSSYCLGLMLIHYLQCGCNPPVLPCLQMLQPDKYLPNSDVRSLELDEELPDFVSTNNENVGQLFVGFLHYYSKKFNYKEKRISVRLGCLLPRVDKILTKEKVLRHWIDIEEPFEQTNTARAVNNPKKAAYIKSVFDTSYNTVVKRGAAGEM